MRTVLHIGAAVLLGMGALLTEAGAQEPPLALDQAVAIALEKNPVRKAAMAETKMAKAALREVRAGLLPQIHFTESALRSNDPVFAFGTKLRQQRFTAADFSLESLNRPHPVADISSRFSGEWTVFDSRRSWLAVGRAGLMAQAAAQQLDRSDQELVFRVVQAYFKAQTSARQLDVAEQSLKTAEAIEESSRARVENGLAVESDLLSAQVQSAERKQQAIRARNDLAMARAELATVLGVSPDTLFTLADAVEPGTESRAAMADFERRALEQRPDLLRIRSEQAAQGKAVAMAKAAFGPRLNTFASWQTDSRSLGWNGGNNWSAGVELQLDLFSGGGKLAQLSRERAAAEQVQALRQSAEDNVRLEVRRAYYDADSAAQELEVARAASAQAEESLRIQKNRYDEGLATVTELLRVEEAVHRAKNNYWNAVYRSLTSEAALELAGGTLTATSKVVKP